MDELDPGDLQRLKLLEDVGGLVSVPDRPAADPQPKTKEEESKGEVDQSPLIAPQQPQPQS